MLIVAGTLTVDPAKTDAVLADAVVMMRATHSEEGNLAYVFSLDPIAPGTVHIFEKWETDEALAAHAQAPHMADFRSKMGGWGITGADLKKYEIASEGPLR